MSNNKIQNKEKNNSIPSYIIEAITSMSPEYLFKSQSIQIYTKNIFENEENLDNTIKEEDKEYYISNYLVQETLGRGNFAKVKSGIYLPTGEKVAIKIIEKHTIIKIRDKTLLKREFDILSKLNYHPNVINIQEIFETNYKYYIVMEYCEGGELYDYLVKKRRLNDEEAAFFYFQIINGLEYIHSIGIAHRDLKPENLLLTKEHILKIIDFGLSNYFKNSQKDLLSTPCGSPSYAAPELIEGKKYNGFKADIWSSGIILYAFLCGFLPFEGKDTEVLFNNIFECKLFFPNYIKEYAKDLIEKILVIDPEKE